jgi:hypothetical protein
VRAFFSTGAPGGQGGSGLAAFCRIINVTFDKEAFEVAKYLDNNDEGRQYRTVMTRTRWNKPLWIVPEIDHDDMLGETNLHAAYFQHPDRVTCRVRQTAPSGCKGLATFDEIQMRLIDPDDNIVAGGPGQTEFTFAPEEKSQRHDGRNGRWLVEVAPGRGCLDDQSLHQGGLAVTPYELICSSGNGHNELDSIGHCMMSCVKDPQNKHQALCPFDSPFNPARCYN